jgi:hypothetical protein
MTGAEIASRFYQAFESLDHETMGSLYSETARFTDPVFDLTGPDIGRMWRALCSGSTDLDLSFEVVDGGEMSALIDWEARYTFPPTGRRIHNRIQSRMTMKDGQIQLHVDQFDFYHWNRQAFGLIGSALGWTPPFRAQVRRGALRAIR